jgi:hypothetical protein
MAFSIRMPLAGDRSKASRMKLFRPLAINCRSAPWLTDWRARGLQGGESTEASAVTGHFTCSPNKAAADARARRNIQDALLLHMADDVYPEFPFCFFLAFRPASAYHNRPVWSR